jgi:NADPH2:quinone reductase
MRAVVFRKFGEPKAVLELEDRPLPEPGPGQVRLKLVLSPIHNHDLAIIRGIYGTRPPLPAVPGTEALGVVEALGPEVGEPALGQRVCVAGVAGAWADSFLARAASVVPVPPAIPDETACQLLAMPLSAVMLLEDLEVEAGDWIVQNAANGAVGRLINVLAKERGLTVINLVRRPEAVAELEAAGAARVVSTDDPGWAARVREIAGAAQLTTAIDSVGGRAANDLMKVLAPGGTLVSFGALSAQPLVIDPGALLFKEATVKGFWATRRAQRTPPAEYARMIGEVFRLASSGALKLGVEATFALAEAGAAAAASERPGRTGKIALG